LGYLTKHFYIVHAVLILQHHYLYYVLLINHVSDLEYYCNASRFNTVIIFVKLYILSVFLNLFIYFSCDIQQRPSCAQANNIFAEDFYMFVIIMNGI